MTPNDIEILIHCYVSPVKHPRYDNIKDILESFVVDGLVVDKGNGIFHTTEKGAAHIRQLCSLPIPAVQYVRFDGVLIGEI